MRQSRWSEIRAVQRSKWSVAIDQYSGVKSQRLVRQSWWSEIRAVEQVVSGQWPVQWSQWAEISTVE